MTNSQDTRQFSREEQHEALIQMRERGEASLHETIAKLDKLLKSVDAIELFIAVIANTCFGPEGSFSEITHGDIPAKIEILSYYAYPYFGKSGSKITPWHINECIEILNSVLALRLMIVNFPTDYQKDDREPDPLERIMDTVRTQAEVVRGSAFPEQTSNEITSIQGRFENWFKKATGIGPNRAQAILWSIIRAHEAHINSVMPAIHEHVKAAGEKWREIRKKSPKNRSPEEAEYLKVFQDEQAAKAFEYVSRLNEIAPETVPIGLQDIDALETPPTFVEWESLISLIGMTKKQRKEMSEIVDVRRRPLFVLPDNRFIIVDISNALDALWESFEQVAKTDQDFFSGQYQRERAKWLQRETAECLLRIFPSQYTYQNLTYLDPDKGDGSTTELDIAVHWGPFLILLEAKAKQFRLEAQLGDIGRLRSDIKANVEDAFDQAKRAVKYIDQTQNPEFIESSTGRRLIIPKDKIHRTYLVTVSQHLLAGLATRLSMFKDLGLFKSEEYPFSISIADLETVTHFCDGPDMFLHYIEKRLATQRESLEILADEL